MLANSTVIAAIPGTRNETKSVPAQASGSLTEARRPKPNATSQRNGRTMLVIRFRRSRRNFTMSRRQQRVDDLDHPRLRAIARRRAN